LGRVVIAQASAGRVLRSLAGVDVRCGGPAVLRNEVVLGGAHGDPVQPGVELRVAAEAADRAPGAQEGFLGDVLDLAAIGDIARDQPRDPVLVLAHQQVEFGLVAALYPRHQLAVPLVHFIGQAAPALQSVRWWPGAWTALRPGSSTPPFDRGKT